METMSSLSRYRYDVAFQRDDVQMMDDREPFRYRAEADNRYHTCQDGDTWWGLAYLYFQGVQRPESLWWLLCEFQPEPVIDPTIKLTAGAVVVIPSMRLLRTKVFSDEQRRYH
jgi:hypothetical protein